MNIRMELKGSDHRAHPSRMQIYLAATTTARLPMPLSPMGIHSYFGATQTLQWRSSLRITTYLKPQRRILARRCIGGLVLNLRLRRMFFSQSLVMISPGGHTPLGIVALLAINTLLTQSMSIQETSCSVRLTTLEVMDTRCCRSMDRRKAYFIQTTRYHRCCRFFQWKSTMPLALHCQPAA